MSFSKWQYFTEEIKMTGETAEQFIRASYELADKCDFTDLSTHIRDRLVVGILDERLSKEMQIMDEETLTEQKAVSMIRQRVCIVWKEIRTRRKEMPKSRGSRQQN